MGKINKIGNNMGIEKKNIIIYSHSEYFDVLHPCYERLKKHLTDDYNIILFADDEFHEDVKTVIYDVADAYGNRVLSCLNQLDENDVCIFMHEDMILYDNPDFDRLNKCFEFVHENQNSSIRLIYAGESKSETKYDWLFRLENGSFTVQPTVISVKNMKDLFQWFKQMSIYDIERCSSSYLNALELEMYSVFNYEGKRGMFHHDSSIFPYIATAINKGKWNLSEYVKEMTDLFLEYKLDRDIRGTV